jgi:hypothetical protein
MSNPFPQGVAQRRHEMASKRALPPGAWLRAAGRKESSLQGVAIAHFVEGKGNPGAARWFWQGFWARKARFAAKKCSFPPAKASCRLGVCLSPVACGLRVSGCADSSAGA